MFTNKQPTDAELEILHILWELGPSTVRTVNARQNEKREAEAADGQRKDPLGYTTSLKLMQIMHEKGLVTRLEDARTHIYTAAVQEVDTQSALLQQFVDNAFRGSAMKMVLQALGNYEAGAEELDEIKALIAQLEQNQSKP